MNPSTQNPSSSVKASGPPSKADSGEADSLTAEDVAQQRAERLAAISAAVNAGHYDSDEMLEKALGIMLGRIEEE